MLNSKWLKIEFKKLSCTGTGCQPTCRRFHLTSTIWWHFRFTNKIQQINSSRSYLPLTTPPVWGRFSRSSLKSRSRFEPDVTFEVLVVLLAALVVTLVLVLCWLLVAELLTWCCCCSCSWLWLLWFPLVSPFDSCLALPFTRRSRILKGDLNFRGFCSYGKFVELTRNSSQAVWWWNCFDLDTEETCSTYDSWCW